MRKNPTALQVKSPVRFEKMMGKNPNHKTQIPNKFKISNSNDRNPAMSRSSVLDFEHSVIGAYLLFVICYLEFSRQGRARVISSTLS